jgi:Tfp pilus assembly protein FimT
VVLVRKARKAYTLLEITLVIAVVAGVAAASYPIFRNMYADTKVKAAADGVRAGMASARARAMEEGRPYRFAVTGQKGNYRIAPDSPDFWEGSGDSADKGNSLVINESLPDGISFTTQEGSAGDWSNAATFMPDGTARDDVEVVFRSEGCKPLALRLRGVTGTVTVEPLDAETH